MNTPTKNRLANPGWFLVSPSVALLLLWMIVPLGMTLYFSLIRYNLLYPGENQFVGLENFTYFITDSGFLPGATNTLLLVGSVLLISVVFGVLISALLEASEFLGRGIVRVLLISPFFIMPTVGALIWKNLIFHPVSGILAAVWKFFGAEPVDWPAHRPGSTRQTIWPRTSLRGWSRRQSTRSAARHSTRSGSTTRMPRSSTGSATAARWRPARPWRSAAAPAPFPATGWRHRGGRLRGCLSGCP